MRLAYPSGEHKINYRNILAQYMDNVKWLDTRFCIKHTLPVKSALPAAGLGIFCHNMDQLETSHYLVIHHHSMLPFPCPPAPPWFL